MNTEIITIRENNGLSADADGEISGKRRFFSLPEVFALAGSYLREGKTVAFPTDTVYGLGAVYSDGPAVRRLFEAKGRPETKPISLLISDVSQLSLLTQEIPEAAKRLMQEFWPGALTLIFRKKNGSGIPPEVTAGGDTIGVRMPDSEIAQGIIRCAGVPVAAPSANRSGARSASCGEEVKEDLAGRIDLLIDGGACPVGISSTVLDVSRTPFRILREGTITREMAERAAGIPVLYN